MTRRRVGLFIVAVLTLLVGAGMPAAAGPELRAAPEDRRFGEAATPERATAMQRTFAQAGLLDVDFVDGELLVTIPHGAVLLRDQISTVPGVRQVRQVARQVLHVTAASDVIVDVAADIAELGGVAAVEPNLSFVTSAVPDDTSYPLQWSHQRTGIEQVWDDFTGSGDAVVAVVDSGVDATHPDLADRVVTNLRVETSGVVPGPVDNGCEDGHGTAVAGVVGAQGDNGFGLAGVLWDVDIIDVNVFISSGEECPTAPSDAVIAALDHLASLPLEGDVRRPDVINLSLGGPSTVCPSSVQTAVDQARQAGITVIAASGNNGLSPGNPTDVPAACNGVISIGATRVDDSIASYSTFNDFVDLAAPAGELGTLFSCPSLEDLAAQKTIAISNTASEIVFEDCPPVSDPNGHDLRTLVGTSFASPYAAGMAALLIDFSRTLGTFAGTRGGLSPDQVEAVLENTARDLGEPGRDPQFGWGIPDVSAAFQAVEDGTIGALQPDPEFPVADEAGPQAGAGECPQRLEPEGAAVRIAHAASVAQTDPILQAIAVSCVLPAGAAPYAVLARVDDFADALAGAAIGFGFGPLHYTTSVGPLDPRTEAELLRVLAFGGSVPPFVFIMGGTSAIPGSVDDRLASLGITPIRIAGEGREQTAVRASGQLEALKEAVGFGRDDAFVVFGRGFPDAVAAGQMAAFYGIPILATNTEPPLHPETAAELRRLAPERVFVVGGPAVISDQVFAEVAGLGFPTQRLAGPTRIGTSLAVLDTYLAQLAADDTAAPRPPGQSRVEQARPVMVNLRANFNDVLSATLATGSGLVFMPLEGATGDPAVPELTQPTRDAFCSYGIAPLVMGGTDVLTTRAVQRAVQVLQGTSC